MEFGKIERGGVENYVRKVRILKSKLDSAEAIFIGAGAGLSNAAGLNSTEIFEHYFSFIRQRKKGVILFQNTILKMNTRDCSIRLLMHTSYGHIARD